MDFQEIEKKWQKVWADKKVFEVDVNNDKKYFITIPYPYISGSLHIGHARVVTEADVFSRFKRMNGFNVLYPIAFHISGTPVLGISMAIKQGDQKKIDLYKGYVRNYVQDEEEVERIVKSFEDPQKIVDFFIPKMIDEFSSLGLGVDWRRSFTSGDIEHQRLVEWQFRKYEEKGFLVKGNHPVLYSISMENAVGEDDIADGDVNPVEKQEFTLLKFLFDNDKYLIAATLRPETMYGQTNLWVNPDVDYREVEVEFNDGKKETWIVSKECAEKLSYQDKKVITRGVVSGRDLLGKKCLAPFVDREIIILPSAHCDPDKGTGIVTSVPSDAPYDWIALKELQDDPAYCDRLGIDPEDVKSIKPIPIIKSKGYGDLPGVEICERMGIKSLDQVKELEEATKEIYSAGFHTGVLNDNCGPFAGLSVQEAKEAMKQELLSNGKGDVMWETSRPAKDRSGGKIIVAVLDDQWFIDFNAPGWKDKARKCLSQLTLIPEKYRKEFEDVLDWLDKRPCARKRGLGTRLPQDPQWVVESLSDSTLYMTLYTIKDKLDSKGISGDQLTKEFFDFVYLGEGSVDVVSKQTGISVDDLKELREAFDYWYPNDHRHTFQAHLSNHLSFSIFAHAGLLPEDKWPRKYTFHGLVISEGQKMSKSKGNIITLLEIKNKYGADPFRAFMCSSTSVESTFNWDSKEIINVKNHLVNLYEFIKGLSTDAKGEVKSVSARAFLSWFNKRLREVSLGIEEMNLRSYANFVLYELMNRTRRVLKKLSVEEAAIISDYLKGRWIRLLAPLTPHLAEELWSEDHDSLVSVESWPEPDESLIDDKAEVAARMQEQISSDLKVVKELAKIDHPEFIKIILAPVWKYDALRIIKDKLSETRNPGEIIKALMSNDELRPHGQELSKLVPAIVKDPSKIPEIIISQDEELLIVNELKQKIESEENATVIVETAEDSKEQKARTALPGKPGIVIG